jgi:hypothetical protein
MATLLGTEECGKQATNWEALLNRADAAIEHAKLLRRKAGHSSEVLLTLAEA